MIKVVCTLANTPDTFDIDVGGRNYVFTRDEAGRMVTDVPRDEDVQIMLATGNYQVLTAEVPAGEKPARGRKAA